MYLLLSFNVEQQNYLGIGAYVEFKLAVSNVDVCVWMCQVLENYWKQLWGEEKQSRGSVSQTINIGVEYCSYISLSLKSQSFSPIPKRPLLILLACSIAK